MRFAKGRYDPLVPAPATRPQQPRPLNLCPRRRRLQALGTFHVATSGKRLLGLGLARGF